MMAALARTPICQVEPVGKQCHDNSGSYTTDQQTIYACHLLDRTFRYDYSTMNHQHTETSHVVFYIPSCSSDGIEFILWVT